MTLFKTSVAVNRLIMEGIVMFIMIYDVIYNLVGLLTSML